MLEKVFADGTLILGLLLATWGSVLLGIDALGAVEFVDVQDDGNPWPQQLWFTASVNTQLRFLLLALIGFGIISWTTHSWVSGAFGAVFTFFAWRLIYKGFEKLTWFVANNPPVRYKGRTDLSFLGCVALAFLLFFILLPWALVAGALFLVWAILEYGITLPSFYVGERVIQPRLRKLYERIAEDMRAERDRRFRETAFRGMLFLIGGFMLQMAGTIYLTTSDFRDAFTKSQPAASGAPAARERR